MFSVRGEAFRDTNPEPRSRNKKSGDEHSAEPLLIGHKGSSYQTRAAAIADAES